MHGEKADLKLISECRKIKTSCKGLIHIKQLKNIDYHLSIVKIIQIDKVWELLL